MEKQIKFMKFFVTDGETRVKVSYALDNRGDQPCVTIYEKDWGHDLGEFFPDLYKNDTDIMTDYFDQGRVTLVPGHALYAAARARAEQNRAERMAPKKAVVLDSSVKQTSETSWEVESRGMHFVIDYRFKPGYKSWLVRATKQGMRFPTAKWFSTLEDMERSYVSLRGVGVQIAPPENCVAFPAQA